MTRDGTGCEAPDQRSAITATEAAVAGGQSTNTAMVDVTTSGPDDYGSADKVPVPKAQEAAKEQDDDQSDDAESTHQKEREDEVAETGTDLSNQPTY